MHCDLFDQYIAIDSGEPVLEQRGQNWSEEPRLEWYGQKGIGGARSGLEAMSLLIGSHLIPINSLQLESPSTLWPLRQKIVL